VNRLDRWEACEVAGIQGKDAFDAVDAHGGCDAGIVDLGAGYGVSNEEPAPDERHCGIVGEHWDLAFDHPRSPISFRRRQAESVAIQWPSEHIPKLAEILRGVAENSTRPNKRIDSPINQRLQGISELKPTYKDVAVEQYAHGRLMGDRRRCLPE